MATPPAGIVLERHLDSPGGRVVWFRRAIVLVVLALLAAGLSGILGQPPHTSSALAPEATLQVEAPTSLRGGLFYQARFTLSAHESLEHATLVLDEGWLDGISINTIEPAPAMEESRAGRLALDFGLLEPGELLVVYLQCQVNPTNVGRRSQDAALLDGDRVIASVERTVTIFP